MSIYSIPDHGTLKEKGLEFTHESHDDGDGDIHNIYIVKGGKSATMEWAINCGTWSGDDSYYDDDDDCDDEPIISQRDMRTIRNVLATAEREGKY